MITGKQQLEHNKRSMNDKIKRNGVKASKVLLRINVYGYACLYMFTGVDKLINIERFTKGLNKVPYLQRYASAIGLGIPVLEILLALMLIIPGRIQQISLWCSTMLMLVFTIFISWMMKYHPNQMCHCGKAIEKMGWDAHLVFNLIWLALGVYAIRYNHKLIHKTKLS
ncbi:MAG: Uncharacterized protein K0R59_556 [Sphingobacterium sp.]|jgi:hypothetical protein|nr:Uncharacterized protein [Sphingobacterium sp.]